MCGAFWQAGISLARLVLQRAGLPLSGVREVAANALLASMPGVLGVSLINRVVFGQTGPVLLIWAQTLPLGLAVAFAYRGVVVSGATTLPVPRFDPDDASAEPASVLPADPGGVRALLVAHAPDLADRRLIALQAEDHYIRLHCDGAETLVLLRMRDAIAALGEGAGWQPHRSFWIARDARVRAERRGQG